MEWQWHQLDHMQIICTSLQKDNHAVTSSLSFYRPDALSATQPTASKQKKPQTDGAKNRTFHSSLRAVKMWTAVTISTLD